MPKGCEKRTGGGSGKREAEGGGRGRLRAKRGVLRGTKSLREVMNCAETVVFASRGVILSACQHHEAVATMGRPPEMNMAMRLCS